MHTHPSGLAIMPDDTIVAAGGDFAQAASNAGHVSGVTAVRVFQRRVSSDWRRGEWTTLANPLLKERWWVAPDARGAAAGGCLLA